MTPGSGPALDPLAILGALERNYVDYVLIGGLAQVLRGADVVTAGVDICPSFAGDNLARLGAAAGELKAVPASGEPAALDGAALAASPVVQLSTAAGWLSVIGSPAGVPNGYVDLRRAATREDLGQGVRPLVASTGDLAAMAAALHREQDLERVPMLRRIVELEVEPAPAMTTASARSRQPRRSISRAPRITP